MIKYAVIGAGWRSEFYLRIARILPEHFYVSGILIKNPSKQKAFSKKYSVKIFSSLNELLKTDFDFIVSCVDKDNILNMAKYLTSVDIPVLTETPITSDKITGRIQVAEQFHFMPKNQAYKRIIESGILGDVNHVKISCCHDYHAASLIRFFLNTGFVVPNITSINLNDHITRHKGRQGNIEPVLITTEQDIRVFKFNHKTAIYDFSFEQYFSDICTNHIIIRGTKGEINDNICTYLKNGIPYRFEIIRNMCGVEENLDGFCLHNITGNNEVLYSNPFPNSRLSDEEIAIATCLTKMKDYLCTGKGFYSIKDAAFDFKMFD